MAIGWRDLKQAVQRWFNVLHQIESGQLVEQSAPADEKQIQSRYYFSRPLPPGWYMLSVTGNRALLGQYITISDATGHRCQLQVSAKPFTKRIYWQQNSSAWLDFHSSVNLSGDKVLKLSLSRVSAAYAASRMQRKLTYSSSQRLSREPLSLELLYSKYLQRIDKCSGGVRYAEWLVNHQRDQKALIDCNPEAMEIKLKLVHLPGAACDTSPRSSTPLEKARTATQQPSFAQHAIAETVENDDSGYICFIGPDVIADANLSALAKLAIARHPNAWLLYPDHDVRSAAGDRSQPCFKPGWNTEMLFAGNYIGQVVIVSQALLSRIGLPDISLGNSSLYDWLLKTVPLLDESQVCRIPQVLYSYADARQGVAAYLSTGEHDEQALEAFFSRSGYPATAEAGLIKGTQRARWKCTEHLTSVDIIIPSKDKVGLLRTCVESVLEKTQYPDFRITVVDNGSTEPATLDWYREMQASPRFNVLRYEGEFNFSALNNYAVKHTSGDILLLMNNDTEVINADWLDNLVAQAIRPENACVGAKLFYGSGQIQHAGVILGLFGLAGHAHRLFSEDDDGYCGRLKIAHNVSAVTAACMAVRREVYIELGGLDEVNLKVAYNDVDFCLRAREAGYQNVWTPHARLYHYESVSRGTEDTLRKRHRFQREFRYMQKRWQIHNCVDNAYSPNLALDSEDFSLAA